MDAPLAWERTVQWRPGMHALCDMGRSRGTRLGLGLRLRVDSGLRGCGRALGGGTLGAVSPFFPLRRRFGLRAVGAHLRKHASSSHLSAGLCEDPDMSLLNLYSHAVTALRAAWQHEQLCTPALIIHILGQEHRKVNFGTRKFKVIDTFLIYRSLLQFYCQFMSFLALLSKLVNPDGAP